MKSHKNVVDLEIKTEVNVIVVSSKMIMFRISLGLNIQQEELWNP
jgi:hypothetical protein